MELDPPVTDDEAEETAAVVALLRHAAEVVPVQRALLRRAADIITRSVVGRGVSANEWHTLWCWAEAVDTGPAEHIAAPRSGRLVMEAIGGCSRGGDLERSRRAHYRLLAAYIIGPRPADEDEYMQERMRRSIERCAYSREMLSELPPDLARRCHAALEAADRVVTEAVTAERARRRAAT